MVILTGVENDCPAAVAVPGPSVHDPEPQFVPAMVAAAPLNETHIKFAELFISIRPRTLPLVNIVCAVPPVVMVPEQSAASAAPAAPHQASAAITHDIIFRILVISNRPVPRHIPRFDKI